MSNLTTKEFFAQDSVQKKFQELLGKRAPQFITSVLQIVTNNNLLAKADAASIYNCAATAAVLDLPLNNSLGKAWIVPYSGKAQFQIGYKGLIELAQRTGQYLRINVVEVYENQFKSWNALTEVLDAEMSIVGTGKIVGYCAYFKMLNGFEKFDYWPIEKVVAHGKRFSKSFNTGPWKDDFDKMAKKTVLKNTLSTWGMLSVEMQTAMVVDQAIIKNDTGSDVEYIDVTGTDIDKEVERAQLMLADCTTIDEVNTLRGQLSKEIIDQIAGDIVDK
ncbi:MAG: recombinase RecT, partial [bacterium]